MRTTYYQTIRCIEQDDEDFIMATESNLVLNRTSLCHRFSILLPEEYNCVPDEEIEYHDSFISNGIRESAETFKWK